MSRFATALCLTTLLGSATAQEFIDTFPKDSSFPPKGWAVQIGKWSVSNGQLTAGDEAAWSFITVNGFNPKNCVIDFLAIYGETKLQFAGAAARFTNPTTTVVGKVQESSVVTPDFDRVFISERGGTGTSAFADLAKKVGASCTVRTILLDDKVWVQVDLDKDGVFDQTIERKLTKLTYPGLIGASAFGPSKIDDFEYHNAVLVPAKAAKPRIASTYKLDLATTSKRKPWLMILSASNSTGIPLKSRKLPVDLDALVLLSLEFGPALGLVGTTDDNGRAQPGFVIPNMPALVGATVFGCAFTIDLRRPFSIDNISNELAIKFEAAQ